MVLVQRGAATFSAATQVTREEAWGIARRLRAEGDTRVSIMELGDHPTCAVDCDQPLD